MYINFNQSLKSVIAEMRSMFFYKLYPDTHRVSDEALLSNLIQFRDKFGPEELFALISTPLRIVYVSASFASTISDANCLTWWTSQTEQFIFPRVISIDQYYKKNSFSTNLQYLYMLFETYQKRPSDSYSLLIKNHLENPNTYKPDEIRKFKLEMLEFCSQNNLPFEKSLFLNAYASDSINDKQTVLHYFSLLAKFKQTSEAFNNAWSVKSIVKRFPYAAIEILIALLNTGMLKNEGGELRELEKDKNDLLRYIFGVDLPIVEKIQLVENALNKNHPLGKVFQPKGFLGFSSLDASYIQGLRNFLIRLLASDAYRPPVKKGHDTQGKDGFDSSTTFSL